jgi:phage shock protein PspC (stress-responsive transcriptional regulator)
MSPDVPADPAYDGGDMTENPTIAEPVDPGPGTAPNPGSGPTPGAGPTTGTTPPSYPPPYAQPRPQLRRSRNDRVIAGVCGGISRHLDVDPVLLRILVVVLTVFTGGAFLLAYLVAWLIIPDDPQYAPITPPPVGYAAGGTGTYADPATGQVYGAPAPAPRVRTEPRSYLGLYAISAAAVVGGLLALLVALGADIPAVIIWAAMLAVVAGGLLVGAWRGRARWLIAPAIVLLLITQAAAFIPRFEASIDGGIGERRWVPTTSTSYELGAGDAVLDLSQVAADADISARVGLGQLTVLVPPDVVVELDAQVDAGEATILGERDTSGSLDTTTTIEALTPGADPVTIDLEAEVGLGNLEVRRAAS